MCGLIYCYWEYIFIYIYGSKVSYFHNFLFSSGFGSKLTLACKMNLDIVYLLKYSSLILYSMELFL